MNTRATESLFRVCAECVLRCVCNFEILIGADDHFYVELSVTRQRPTTVGRPFSRRAIGPTLYAKHEQQVTCPVRRAPKLHLQRREQRLI